MEFQAVVKCVFIDFHKEKMGDSPEQSILPKKLVRHGGLIRSGDQTKRIRKGRFRCPPCAIELHSCVPSPALVELAAWHDSLEQYLLEVGSHGIPEGDRPTQCPRCLQGERKPHRHSRFKRTVITTDQLICLFIFRFRCSLCHYVHSVIPAFLEPYQRLSLDVQEELVEAAIQGVTLEHLAEDSAFLPLGPYEEKTIRRLVRSWNDRLTQLETGLWAFLLARVPQLTLGRSPLLWPPCVRLVVIDL